MESGDIIDAHLEQVCTVITSPGYSSLSIPPIYNSLEDAIGANATPPRAFVTGYLYDRFRQ